MFALKENNKARFKELLLNEVLKSDLIYTNKTEVSNQIDEFLKNMSFYFNSDKIIFIFDPYVI
ncbi:MAG: RsiV family protein [Candidatus Peribacteria bacterium]|jgi:hypothetical protein|nr:RsiV family protein [Candidatus Peribacteria bacterium]